MGTEEGLRRLAEEFDEMEKQSVRVLYRNYKGEVAIRNIHPLQFYWSSTEYYPREQWLVRCDDVDKRCERTFALNDVLAWGDEAIAAYQAMQAENLQLRNERAEMHAAVIPSWQDEIERLKADNTTMRERMNLPAEMVFADGREPTQNERHLFNLLTWREHEAKELKREVERLRNLNGRQAMDLQAVRDTVQEYRKEILPEWRAEAEALDRLRAWAAKDVRRDYSLTMEPGEFMLHIGVEIADDSIQSDYQDSWWMVVSGDGDGVPSDGCIVLGSEDNPATLAEMVTAALARWEKLYGEGA